MRATPLTVLLTGLALLLTGCVTVGVGKTEREWNAALKALEPGLTQAQLLTMLGEPRERIAPSPEDTFDSKWIYSRPEIIGTRNKMTGEHDIRLPNGKDTVTVPTFEDRDIRVIAEYHLYWQGDVLTDWERIELN